MFGKDDANMNAQNIYLNEDEPTQDAAFEILDAILDGDVYGWNAFFAWKDLEKIYSSARK